MVGSQEDQEQPQPVEISQHVKSMMKTILETIDECDFNHIKIGYMLAQARVGVSTMLFNTIMGNRRSGVDALPIHRAYADIIITLLASELIWLQAFFKTVNIDILSEIGKEWKKLDADAETIVKATSLKLADVLIKFDDDTNQKYIG